ncbi:MAG: tetratricopeptide repeat protein, partial [Lewinella sp.]|nr:tetratricopeptide repeat protein [Lewinella sp.]
DSLILRAESYLKDQAYDEAKEAYERALQANPNHYFLADALAHIEYYQHHTAAERQAQYQAVVGSYGDRNFWMEDGRLYYKRLPFENRYFPTMELLPISENRYINLTRQRISMAFDFQNEQATASFSYVHDQDPEGWHVNSLEGDYHPRD